MQKSRRIDGLHMKFCASLFFLMHFQKESKQIIAWNILFDALSVAEKCIKNNAAFSFLF